MMAIMAPREFECILCQAHFTLLSGDLMVPYPVICDDCLVELWQLEGDALVEHVSKRLAENRSPNKKHIESYIRQGTLGETIIRDVQGIKQRGMKADEIIRDREQVRQLG